MLIEMFDRWPCGRPCSLPQFDDDLVQRRLPEMIQCRLPEKGLL